MKATTDQERYGNRLIEVLRIASLAACMLMTQSALGQYIPTIDLISETFGAQGNPGEQSWGAAAYSLTVGTFVLPSGRAGDIFGYKKMVLIGLLWFSLWSMVCGLSSYTRSVIFFDFCRAMQGIGPAIILPNSVAILARIYPPGTIRRLIAFSLYAAAAPNGFLIGGVFGTLLATYTPQGWPWAFYVIAIALLVQLVVVYISVPSDSVIFLLDMPEPDAPPDGSSEEQAAVLPEEAPHKPTFDWLGSIIGVSGLILFNFAWSQAPLVGWKTPYVYVLMLVGILLIAAFFYVENKVKDPLLPTSIWTLQSSLIIGCVAFGWSSFGILIFYWLRFMSVINEQLPLLSMAQLSPAGITGIIAAASTVVLLRRVGPGWVMLVSMLAFLISLILVGTLPPHQIYWAQSFVTWLIAPLGMDCSFPAATLIISEALAPHQQGVGSSLVNTVINYSIALGLGFAGTVETYVADGSTLKGFRGALYMGIGLAAAGVVCALVNKAVEVAHHRRKAEHPPRPSEKHTDA